MGKLTYERLIYEILSVVEDIPEGKVATYGLSEESGTQPSGLLR